MIQKQTSWRGLFRTAMQLAVVLGYVCVGLARAQPGEGNTLEINRKAWAETNRRATELRDTAPTEAVALCQKFLDEHPGLDPHVGVDVFKRMASLQAIQLKDPKSALESLNRAQKLYGDAIGPQIVVIQARQMEALQQYPAAEALLKAHWPDLVRRPKGDCSLAWRLMSTVLKQQGKSAENQQLLEVSWRASPVLMDDRSDKQADWISESIVDYYLSKNDTIRALSWAKLRFVTCAYNDEALARAGQQLALIWGLGDTAASEAFLKALNDPAKPNPLAKIALPPIESKSEFPVDVPPLDQLWQRSLLHEKISMLIWRGQPEDYSRAMLEAIRAVSDKSRREEGVQEVCRIFKAHDLNLVRAHAYLTFLKDGNGENPAAVFIREQSQVAAQSAKAGDLLP